MKEKLESIEFDLRNWGQKQMAAVSTGDMMDLRLICDRINAIRRELANSKPGLQTSRSERRWSRCCSFLSSICSGGYASRW